MKKLPHYAAVLSGKSPPVYKTTKTTLVEADLSASLEELWKAHEDRKKGATSLLDLKNEIAKRIYGNCIFCERRCMVNRNEKRGECNVGESLLASEFLHWGEESLLVPSHTVFFSGCNFHCVFCQNHDISQNTDGVPVSEKNLARIIEKKGGKNLNLVGGEPTPNLSFILRLLRHLEFTKPIIWNSNMYMTGETMRLLDGIVDLYLADFKYGNSKCAKKYSRVDDYFEIISRNHHLAENQADLLIRHLVMPGHLECCTREILKWISENLHSVVNLMFQYHPEYGAHHFPEIDRFLTGEEKRRAQGYAKEFGIEII